MKGKEEETNIHLTLKSRYLLRSLATRESSLETRGIFRGIVSVGTVDGIAMELDETHGDLKGKMRVIPTHMVTCIDILEAVKEEKENREESHMHYT